MGKTAEEQAEDRGGIIAFRAAPELIMGIDVVASRGEHLHVPTPGELLSAN
jgi:hypothetical protein